MKKLLVLFLLTMPGNLFSTNFEFLTSFEDITKYLDENSIEY